MSALTHWKKGDNPDYLGSYAFQPNEEKILTIKKVGYEMIVGADGKKEECRVAHFMENEKPMILNSTNCKTIAKLKKSPYLEDWTGLRIQIYSTLVKAFGDEVEALRIRTKIPQATKPTFDEKNAGWNKALESLANKETTVEQIEKKYTLSSEVKKKMEEIQNA